MDSCVINKIAGKGSDLIPTQLGNRGNGGSNKEIPVIPNLHRLLWLYPKLKGFPSFELIRTFLRCAE